MYLVCNCGIMGLMRGGTASPVGYEKLNGKDLRRNEMKSFYEQVWVPFVMTKKRILILAIASYIALC